MKRKIGLSIAGSSLLLAILTLFGKSIGFFREIIYANKFGLSTEFDLFLVGSAIPIAINTVIIYLSQNYFIPGYNNALRQSQTAADEFFNYSFWLFFLGGICISLILLIFSSIIIDLFFPSSSVIARDIGLKIYLLFLLTIPFNSGISLITSKLLSEFNFLYPATIQILLNTLVIISILLFAHFFAIYVLPLSFIIAYIIAFLVLFSTSAKKIKFNFIEIIRRRNTNTSINTFLLLVIIEVLSLSYMLVDRFFYDKVPSGGIASLNYAIVIFALPISIFSIPFITIVFSKFSKYSMEAPELIVKDYMNSLKINNFIIIPICFLFYFRGATFLKIFYEHGQFSAISTNITASTLKYYTIGLLFYSAYLIVVKYLYSLNLFRIVMFISLIAFALKLVLNILTVDKFYQNGLAFSTSIIYTLSFLLGFYFNTGGIKLKEKYFYFKSVLYFLLNSLISFSLVEIILAPMHMSQMMAGIMGATIFSIIYLFNSFLMGDNEFVIIKNTISKLWKQLVLKIEN